MKIVAIDLFCGAGGLTHGLQSAGIDVRLGVDIDPACQYPYKQNNEAKFLLKSVAELSGSELSKHFDSEKYTVLAGCAPCQPFSTYRQGKSDETDGRWNLLGQFQRLVLEMNPTVVTMENVPGLMEQTIFADFVSALEAAGYKVSARPVKCADYGVPQQRERLVLLASRLGPLELIPPTHKKHLTVRQAIGYQPQLNAGGTHPKDSLHHACSLSATNSKRIKASRPGGTWRDWEESLVAACHKKKTGKTYPSVYGRMTWDDPSPTLTTQFYGFGNGRFGHPEQDRAISLREGAILQSFPKRYRFVDPKKPTSTKDLGRLIGNAVPVKLGEAIGKTIRLHIEASTRGHEPKSRHCNMRH